MMCQRALCTPYLQPYVIDANKVYHMGFARQSFFRAGREMNQEWFVLELEGTSKLFLVSVKIFLGWFLGFVIHVARRFSRDIFLQLKYHEDRNVHETLNAIYMVQVLNWAHN